MLIIDLIFVFDQLANPNRVLGAFLINATAASNNILDSIQDKVETTVLCDLIDLRPMLDWCVEKLLKKRFV